jgi:hypothetical protein
MHTTISSYFIHIYFLHFKKTFLQARHGCSHIVILATWEAEIGRIKVPG